MTERKILLSNDDGIDSPGFLRLVEAAVKFGRVWVAAPSKQCSGMSHKLTIFEPITVEQVEYPIKVEAAWKIGGTPADCVKMAITALMEEKPDIVLSGINKGYNGGHDIAYSGTVGAAMEALLNDVPAIAFSNDSEGNHAVSDAVLEDIIAELLNQPASLTEIWNVNFPGCSLEEYQGIQRNVTIAPTGMYENFYTKLTLETGCQAMQPGATMLTREKSIPGTDLYAILHGYTAIGKVKSVVKQ